MLPPYIIMLSIKKKRVTQNRDFIEIDFIESPPRRLLDI